jgi:thiol-disulfide isomerase/thioredoxin/tetratricopeptide (TPR) repeat protein
MKGNRLLFIVLLILDTPLIFAQYDNTPKPGDQAPPLTLQQAIKGESFSEFKKGQVYVVEFSATWCSPCRKAIPHLTELAKQYAGRVNFISVYMEDNNTADFTDLSYIKKVQYFIEAMGSKIGFNVAVDVPQQTSKKAWGINGIPAAFVINELGKVAWVGHPMDIDQVLLEKTTGKFDPVNAMQKQAAFKSRLDRVLKSKTLSGVDSLIKENPEKNWLYTVKFNMLVENADQEKTYTLVRYLLDSDIKNFEWLALTAGFKKIPAESRNHQIELQVLDRAIEESETRQLAAYPMYSKSETYATLGDLTKAIEWSKRAIEYSKLPWEASIDWSTSENQLYAKGLVSYQYRILVIDNPTKAGEELRSEVKDKQIQIDEKLIKIILEAPRPDYDLALELVSNAFDKEQSTMYRGYLLGLKSNIYAEMKNFKKAIELCELAIAEYKKEGGNPRLAKKQAVVLQEYKQKLGGG